jgi:hypothetical protein
MLRGLLACSLLAASIACAQDVTVPFVGCPSDGQVGPRQPPHGSPKTVSINQEAASHLAWYQAEQGWGVLAPRGWHCFSTYGSSGSNLFVAPQPLSSKTFFPDNNGSFTGSSDASFTGPAIQLSEMLGDTSGRFSVALSVARLFPAHRDFAENVREEHLLINQLPSGPAPTDKLHYLSKETVEFITPANHDGEGTNSLLTKSSLPITGVVMLTGEELSCTTLVIRLPPDLEHLAPVITKQLERDGASAPSK